MIYIDMYIIYIYMKDMYIYTVYDILYIYIYVIV